MYSESFTWNHNRSITITTFLYCIDLSYWKYQNWSRHMLKKVIWSESTFINSWSKTASASKSGALLPTNGKSSWIHKTRHTLIIKLLTSATKISALAGLISLSTAQKISVYEPNVNQLYKIQGTFSIFNYSNSKRRVIKMSLNSRLPQLQNSKKFSFLSKDLKTQNREQIR